MLPDIFQKHREDSTILPLKLKKFAENCLNEHFTLIVDFRPSDRQIAENVRQRTLFPKLELR